MQLKLKNGKVVHLQWNWLVIERLESTVGDLKQLTKKNIAKRGEAKMLGDMAFAVVQANLDEEITRDDLVKLIQFEDMKKIGEFVKENNKQAEDFASKKT